MTGATHGLAGLTIGAALVLGVDAAGAQLTPPAAAAVIVAGAIAGELPDLDLGHSRVSRGTTTLAALPLVGGLALVVTLPVVLAGILIRRAGVTHRGPTHSPAAALLWALAIVPLYTAYLHALRAGAGSIEAAAAGHEVATYDRLTIATDAALATLHSAGPAIAAAVLLAQLSHLALDDLTTARQALKWPVSAERVGVLARPNIRVGGAAEHLLITLPLTLAAGALLWQIAGRGMLLGVDS